MIDLRKKVVWKQNWEINGYVNNVLKEILVYVYGDQSIVLFIQRLLYGLFFFYVVLNYLVNL